LGDGASEATAKPDVADFAFGLDGVFDLLPIDPVVIGGVLEMPEFSKSPIPFDGKNDRGLFSLVIECQGRA